MSTLYQIPNSPQYFITKEGTVWSAKRNKWLKVRIKENYALARICINGKHKYIPIHRILANLFIPNPNNLPYVNHIDGNPRNNNLSNLEWVTHQQNMQHASSTHLLGRKDKYTGTHFNTQSGKWIARKRINGKQIYIGTYSSQQDAHSACVNLNWNPLPDLN